MGHYSLLDVDGLGFELDNHQKDAVERDEGWQSSANAIPFGAAEHFKIRPIS
jgi:hypothetical protein